MASNFSVEKAVNGFRYGILGRDIVTPLTRGAKGTGSCFPTLAMQGWGTRGRAGFDIAMRLVEVRAFPGLRSETWGTQRHGIDDFERSCGPHSQQALGWAWKRRLSGSSYSAWQAGHIVNGRHGGLRPVVGNAAGDGEAGAAVGAVEERVAVAAVFGIESSSRRQSGQVAASAGMPVATWPLTSTGNDAEAGFASGGQVADGDGVDAGQGRSFGAKTEEEGVDARSWALKFDGDALGVVGDRSGEVFFCGQAVDEGAKADALDDTADENCTPTAHGAVLGVLRGFFARFRFWLG